MSQMHQCCKFGEYLSNTCQDIVHVNDVRDTVRTDARTDATTEQKHNVDVGGDMKINYSHKA